MKAYLHLADGSAWEGTLRGFDGQVTGEVVFTTGMTGYPQAMTDPSFANQILVFTYPLIGNYGIEKPEELFPHLMRNFESEKIWVKAVVMQSLTKEPSHYSAVSSFETWCTKQQIPIVTNIDTRALTIVLRETGVMPGVISKSAKKVSKIVMPEFDYHQVSIAEPITYRPKRANKKHIALIDCGVKHGILRALINRGFTVTRVPWNANPLDLGIPFDGVLVSNGPGDPKDWMESVVTIQKVLDKKLPFVGICLGHQLLALAIGGDTYKMKYGHRGINQPCQDVVTKHCYLTSQNHGYAVKTDSIPKGFSPWFINLNDGTNEGLVAENKKIWSSQFHPEGNPGPFDSDFIFDKFL